ncbi:MAG: hypothetical protein LUE16_11750, partial [Lachnospiraceae bacterium]|nr:hypothetical protein [Lachnospiraceae bacterium]
EMEVDYMASSWWLIEEKEKAYREGEAKGEARGEARGEAKGGLRKVVDQSCRKLAKGKTVEEIADALECDLSQIDVIVEVAQKYAPGYDVDKILEELCKEPLP